MDTIIETRRPITELTAKHGDALIALELSYEERMVTMGREQVRKQIEKAREKGNEGSTQYGQTFIGITVDAVSQQITDFIEKATSGRAGRRHSAVKYLQQTEADIAAFMGLRCVVDSLTGKRQLLQRVAINIATRIEDEVRFTAFHKDHKVGYERGMKKVKVATTYGRKRASLGGFEKRYTETEWTPWPEADKLHLGMLIVDMIVNTGHITVGEEIKSIRDTVKVLHPTAQLVEWIERESLKSEAMASSHLPMVVEPLEWTDPFNGGYLTQDAQGRNALVKVKNQNYLTEMADRKDEMPAVYSSINALQSTRWAINSAIYEVAEEMWGMDTEASALPSREDVGQVPCPVCGQGIELAKMNTRTKGEQHDCFEDEFTGEETLKAWRKVAYETHTANVSLRSKRMVTAKTLKVASMFKDLDVMYFPYQLDFRGRIYAIPSFNPQGADLTKGLIHFADGMAIEDGVAAGWLAIQGANVFGFDKASLEDRIGWVEDHADMILACAYQPMDNAWWMTADKPWQFLAFCFEWAQFCEEGYGFVSHLPVALDGSCSGIQHFSAMLRDPVGGEAVNLTPQETPADIYQKVCDRVVIELEKHVLELGATIPQEFPSIDSPMDEDLLLDEERVNLKSNSIEETIDERSFASGWLSLGLSRKTTKRQVMTLPYGSTQYSCREYTEVWLKEQLASGYDCPWPKEQSFKATQYLSKLIWDAISSVVVAAREAMDWLQGCAKVVAKEQLPVYWQTPSGFPVMQVYKNTSSRRIKTKLGDTIVKLSLQQEEPTIDRRRMANAISPNFVHSLDATHLVLSTDLAVTNGIHHFAMIHDSFGTHAANTDRLAACLREAFVGLYHEKDVLEDFRQQIMRQVDVDLQGSIKPVPTKGTLDVTTVRDSDFFFA